MAIILKDYITYKILTRFTTSKKVVEDAIDTEINMVMKAFQEKGGKAFNPKVR